MSYRRELCRNFQRGSCQYGERCKFIHATPQQQQQSQQRTSSSTNNPFGFGSNHQQQKSNNNPFGFGPQPVGGNVFANSNQQQHFKPFENKWTRSTAVASKQPDNQNQAANHTCTDPDSCKRLIAEDFEKERPLWKLTCYGHLKHAPCDIVGDLSYEELRAAAYDEAKHGLPLQSIVERERNLLNTKLVEFENLLCNPYTPSSKSSLPGQGLFQRAGANAIPISHQNGAPPSVSSFSQLRLSLNTGSGTRPSMSPGNAFGQPNLLQNATQAASVSNNVFGHGQQNPFSNFSQTSNAFGERPSVPSNNVFAQPTLSAPSSQTSNAFNISPAASVGLFGSQTPTQAAGISFPTSTPGFGNASMSSSLNNAFSSSAFPPQSLNLSSVQHPVISNGLNSAGQAATSAKSVNDVKKENASVDTSVWLKESWIPGEVPEEAPPDEYVH